MMNFKWNRCFSRLASPAGVKRVRQSPIARVEDLELRTLLSANLPVAVSDTYFVDQGSTLTATTSVLANDTDADGDTISQAVLQNDVTHGSLTLNANGTFTYSPVAGFTGSDSFTYFAKDIAHNETSSSAATVTINVTTNAPPVVDPVTLSTTVNTALAGTLTGTDADGDILTFTEGSAAATHGSVVVNSDGAFTFTPVTGFAGAATFTYRANDGSADSADATVTINVTSTTNTAPAVSPVTFSTSVGTAVSGTLSGTDAEGNTLTFSEGSTTATHGTVAINPNGTFTFTPAGGFSGVATFSYKASDGHLSSDDAVVTINVATEVNTAPVVSPMTLSTAKNTAVSGALTGVDADGDTLTFSKGNVGETHGKVVINPNGTFTFTPKNGFTGVATFSYKASDGKLTSNTATVTINVGAAANTAPVVGPVTISTSVNSALSGTLSGTDAEGDTLTFSEGSTAATHGTVVIHSNGTFTFTPTNGFTGVAAFSYLASDGKLTSNQATVTVHVNAQANSAPTVVNGSGATTENSTFNGSLVSLATDPEGDSLTFAVASQPEHGSVNVNADGTFTFTPENGFSGTTSFTFTASDGSLTSLPATFSIAVSEVNQGGFDLVLQETVKVSKRPNSPTPLDPNAAVTNVAAGTNFANAQLTASFQSSADQKKDRLVVIKHGAVDVKGRKVFVNGHQVATIVSKAKKGGSLQINFNSNVTQASIEAVLQRIAMQTNPGASDGARTVQLQLSADGLTATDSIVVTV